MSVLDPIEVAEVEVWPFYLKGKSKTEIEQILASAEYTVKKKVVELSKLKFVLNEKDIPQPERSNYRSHTGNASFLSQYTKRGNIPISGLRNVLRR
jgi:hypothetical protein